MRKINRREFIGGALTSNDLRAHNTFADPRALVPAGGAVKAGGPAFVYRFAPASVTRLQMSPA